MNTAHTPGTASQLVDAYLVAADRLLVTHVSGARGTWPRACAWLLRLALETELTAFWQRLAPPVAGCRSHRAQLLLLPRYAGRDLARQATHAWTVLSAAGHHHSYELALTAAELRRLHDDVTAIVTGLRRPPTAATPARDLPGQAVSRQESGSRLLA